MLPGSLGSTTFGMQTMITIIAIASTTHRAYMHVMTLNILGISYRKRLALTAAVGEGHLLDAPKLSTLVVPR